MVVHQRKSHRRAAAIEAAVERVTHLVDLVPNAPSLAPLDGVQIDGTPLDPAAGELNADRAARKREQILSTAAYATRLLRAGDRVVEFGAGQGHLGLLIAHLRPDVDVTLLEVKEYSCDGARARVDALGLRNCAVFCGTVDAFATSGARLDCAVGLHLCGLLTDSVLELALARRAAVCVVPCCYGQIVGGTDHVRGSGTTPFMHPRSSAFRETLAGGKDAAAAARDPRGQASSSAPPPTTTPPSRDAGPGSRPIAVEPGSADEPAVPAVRDTPAVADTPGDDDAFRTVAQAADTAVVGKGGSVDPDSAASKLARRCMRIVDSDRCLYALDRWARGELCAECAEPPSPSTTTRRLPRVSVGSLSPLACTPKSSLILIERPPPSDVEVLEL